MQQCISQVGLPINKLDGEVKPGNVRKPKGALQIAFECGFFNATLKIHEIPVSIHGHKVTNAKEKELVDGSISNLHLFIDCDDFRKEKTQLQYSIEVKLSGFLRMTPKFHPDLFSVCIEYSLGYANPVYGREFKNSITKHIYNNMKKLLCQTMIKNERV